MDTDELSIKPGPRGWVMASGSILSGTCFIQFFSTDEGWQAVTLHPIGGLTPEFVRTVPINRIQIAVNASEWVTAQLALQLADSIEPPPSEGFLRAMSGFGHAPEPPISLKRPAGKRLSDAWYGEVARAYKAAAARGLKPRTTIAHEAGVSLDVAGRWIYQARKRGHLPPTQPGKVNARVEDEGGAVQ
jgi:hypothetical protein